MVVFVTFALFCLACILFRDWFGHRMTEGLSEFFAALAFITGLLIFGHCRTHEGLPDFLLAAALIAGLLILYGILKR
jgi:hypothetical protein